MESNIKSKYPNLYRQSKGTAKKVAHILGEYGWLNSVYEVAMDGIFTKGWKYSPLKSVEETDVWEVLTYLSWKSATAEYKNTYQELEQKRLKNKG